ncbi:hypothetical protein HDU67_004408 [Dinochytrium kinnereticum]|nr:hypothetical protein HDU67_004408 [Dinochytrium kinnereticum]
MALVAPSPTSVPRTHFSKLQESNTAIANQKTSAAPPSLGSSSTLTTIVFGIHSLDDPTRVSEEPRPSPLFDFCSQNPVQPAVAGTPSLQNATTDTSQTTATAQRTSATSTSRSTTHRSPRASSTVASAQVTPRPPRTTTVTHNAPRAPPQRASKLPPRSHPPAPAQAAPCNCSEAKAETAATRRKLERAESRVASLEKTIEFLQSQHSVALKGLHEEIARLQNLCADRTFRKFVLAETTETKEEAEPDRVDTLNLDEDFSLPYTPYSCSSSTGLDSENISDPNSEENLQEDTTSMPAKQLSVEAKDIQTLPDDADHIPLCLPAPEHDEQIDRLRPAQKATGVLDAGTKRKLTGSYGGAAADGPKIERVSRVNATKNTENSGRPSLVSEDGTIGRSLSMAKSEETELHHQKETVPEKSDASPPYNLILQQQKRKYQDFIERLNTDNKRKQKEIESLRSELELIRDVLALSGLDIDLVELRALVLSKTGQRLNPAEALASRSKKLNILPPIGAGQTDEDAGTIHDIEEHAASIVLDRKTQPLSDLLRDSNQKSGAAVASGALEAVAKAVYVGSTANEGGPESVNPRQFLKAIVSGDDDVLAQRKPSLISPIPPNTSDLAPKKRGLGKTGKSRVAGEEDSPDTNNQSSAKLRSHRYRHRVLKADQPGDEAGRAHMVDTAAVPYFTNPNLDYQSRSRALRLISAAANPDDSVSPEPAVIDAPSAFLPPLNATVVEDVKSPLPALPLKKVRAKNGALSPTPVSGLGSAGVLAASTVWSKRVLGTKVLRSKQLKERQEEGKL